MLGQNAQLDYGREISYLESKDSYLGNVLRRLVDAVNNVAEQAAVASVGKVTPPPKVDSVQVQGVQVNNVITCPSEILHWTITHNQSLKKGIRYFSEIDTDPNFSQPHVIDHGTGRTGILSLPTFSSLTNQTNNVPTSYYLRSYAQYTGSDSSRPTVVGNLTGASQIVMTGTSVTDLLPSTGSGTASTSGQQGGKGLGSVQKRSAPQPKRSVR